MARKRPSKARRVPVLTGTIVPAHGDALTREQRVQLAEAIRQGEVARAQAESAFVNFGRWLLVNVFQDDTTEALEGKRANPVWHALLAHAGGPKLRLSRTSLHLAVQIAAYDKRLNDEAFRGLDVSRQRTLVVLGGASQIRAAAHHVAAQRLTVGATQAYVRELLAEAGAKPAVRMTPRTAAARTARVARFFGDRDVVSKWKVQLNGLDGERRRSALAELRQVARAVRELLEALER